MLPAKSVFATLCWIGPVQAAETMEEMQACVRILEQVA